MTFTLECINSLKELTDKTKARILDLQLKFQQIEKYEQWKRKQNDVTDATFEKYLVELSKAEIVDLRRKNEILIQENTQLRLRHASQVSCLCKCVLSVL